MLLNDTFVLLSGDQNCLNWFYIERKCLLTFLVSASVSAQNIFGFLGKSQQNVHLFTEFMDLVPVQLRSFAFFSFPVIKMTGQW